MRYGKTERREQLSTKAELITRILDIEWDMFQNVPTLQRTDCQEAPGGFQLIRGSIFETWSEATLESYHNDLVQAVEEGKNLNEGRNIEGERYARLFLNMGYGSLEEAEQKSVDRAG